MFRTPGQVALMQWLNQSFNALVNYTNRNAASTLTNKQMIFAYLSATTTALGKCINTYCLVCDPIFGRLKRIEMLIVEIPSPRSVSTLPLYLDYETYQAAMLKKTRCLILAVV